MFSFIQRITSETTEKGKSEPEAVAQAETDVSKKVISTAVGLSAGDPLTGVGMGAAAEKIAEEAMKGSSTTRSVAAGIASALSGGLSDVIVHGRVHKK